MATNATPAQTNPQQEWVDLQSTYSGIVARVTAASNRGEVSDAQWDHFRALGAAVQAAFNQGNLTLAKTAVNTLSTTADAVVGTASGAPAPQPAPAPAPTGGIPTPPAPAPVPAPPAPAPPAPAPAPGAPAPTGSAPDWFTAWDSGRFQPVVNKVDDLVDRVDAVEDVTADLDERVTALEQGGVRGLNWRIGGISALIVLIALWLVLWLVFGLVFVIALVTAAVVAVIIGFIAAMIGSFFGRRRRDNNTPPAPAPQNGNQNAS